MLDARAIPDAFRVGRKLKLIPGHCDPTVNLHDWFIAVRGVASKRPGRSLPAAPAGKGGNGPEPPLPALRITGHVRSRPHRDSDLESSIAA